MYPTGYTIQLFPSHHCDFPIYRRKIATFSTKKASWGITTLDNKTRRDKNSYRKVQVNELAEAINDIIPALSKNKTGIIPKMALYRQLMQKNYFARSQLSQTSFYRMVRENDLLNIETTKKLRQSFCMQFANELWQADTMYGPSIKQADGSWKKTFLIGFFRGFRDRFLVQYLAFNSLEELNDLTHNWIENAYNNQKHKNTCTARRLFGGDW